jgi:L-cystine transport system permease protein
MQFDVAFMFEALWGILPAVPMTLAISVAAAILGFLMAVGLVYLRHHRFWFWSRAAHVYVSFFRGTPMMLHIFLFFYGFPVLYDHVMESLGMDWKARHIPLSWMATFGLSLGAAAYFAEILRGGIDSVGKGEEEAAASIGMTRWQTMRRILLPQAMAITQKSLGSRCISLLHGSALAFWISVIEITGKANLVAASTYQFVEAFIAAALVYWLLTIILDFAISQLDLRYQRKHQRGLA